MDIVKKLCEIARVIIMFMYPTLKEFFMANFLGEIEGGQKYYTEWFDDMQQK